jgi:hypothetical protein
MRVRYASEMDGPVLGGGFECGACHKNGCFDTVDFARITKQLLGRTSAGLLPRSSVWSIQFIQHPALRSVEAHAR